MKRMKYSVFLFLLIVSDGLAAQSPGSNTVATDAVGRKLPAYEEAGGIKKDKFVGLFYWTWHTRLAAKNPPFNVTE